ncbi:MAG: hypothetical protein IJJ04_00240 [Clostridia bacterium]|nr:hypothetical protein [Clostridia bacterium]
MDDLISEINKFPSEDVKYAEAISSIIINCNVALKQYKKVDSKKSKEKVVYAILKCKNLKFLKKTYKNSLEFLERADLNAFHEDKKPSDITKSLDFIIDELKKLSPAENTYVLKARDFIEHKSKFPNRVQNLNDICRFIEKNVKILLKKYPKFENIEDDKDIYESLQDNKLKRFEDFQKQFMASFEAKYKIKLKSVKMNK